MRLMRMAALMGALVALAACGGSGSSSSSHNLLTVHGGKASNGAGGDAGSVYVYGYGGQITVKTEGGLPTLPTWTYTAPDLGTNPLTLGADTDYTVGDTVYGDDGVNPATGIWVKKGVTVTLTPETEPTATITVSNGVLIEGTVVMALLTGIPEVVRDASSLEINAESIAVSGTVKAVGADAAAGVNGGNGGNLVANVDEDFFLGGSLLSMGGKGDVGGNGGYIDVTVDGPAWAADVVPSTIAVTGLADSSGGEGVAGAGGTAGYNEIWGSWGAYGACNFFNSGTFRARGGNGTAGGGDGGPLYVSSCSIGWAVNKGTLDGSGGSATADGAGGSASSDGVWIEAAGGMVYAGGKLLSAGGAGAGSGGGGSGGEIYVDSNQTWSGAPDALGVHVSAQLDASGGDGATGSSGGYIEVFDQGAATDAGITLYNYATLDCAGGDGTTEGGAGGDCQIYPGDRFDSTAIGNVVGPLVNQAKIDVTGGDASAGAGGEGGYSWVGTWVENVGNTLLNPETVQTVNTGVIDARGGKGTTIGGTGGYVDIYDVSALQSKATIDVSGGAGGSGDGGQGGEVHPYGQTTCTVTGKILASGGASSSASGGQAGYVEATGTTVSLAAVTADGGNGAAATGGDGGNVALTSSTPPSTLTGTISVRPGAGTTAGTEGTFTMDGTVMTLTDGRYTP